MARFYHDEVLPTRIKIVNRTLLQYNAMQVSPYELFLAKSAELEAERGYIDTLRDYWITRANSSALSEESFPPQIFLPARTEKPPRKNHEESTRFHAPRLCRPNRLPGRGCRLAASPQSANAAQPQAGGDHFDQTVQPVWTKPPLSPESLGGTIGR